MTTPTDERPPPNPELVLANWHHELDAAELYNYLADREPDAERKSILLEMAQAETRHAGVMERGLERLGVALPPHKLGTQTRAIKTLARVFGNRIVYPLLHGMEISGTAEYAAQDAATAALAPDERSHARVLGKLSEQGVSERWHRSGGGGTLRAAVFGISDGLLSNLSLIMGFTGAAAEAKVILLAGMAGLLAGASSMAAGEYISMKAQRELFERQIELESAELAVTPEEEMEELAMIYRAKGIPADEARRLAQRLSQDHNVALDTLVREELGLDPGELGSPWGAAIGSFLSFAVGAFIPTIPFFFGASLGLIALSAVLAGVSAFAVGASLSIFTGRNFFASGFRQLAIGAVAATLTFGLGKVIGVSTGI